MLEKFFYNNIHLLHLRKRHDEWPAIAFGTSSMSYEDKEKITEFISDFCVIEDED